jgi:predicted AlkP superfamily pyrophosphatase or phosphodiesterase
VFDQNGKASIAAVRPERLAELRDNGVPIDLYFRWYSDLNLHGAADAVLAQAASHVIKRHKPNLLAIHILATDMLQHAYGPEHYLAQAALTAADNSVGILRRAVDEAGIAGRTVFFIVADHGFHQVVADLNLYPLLALSGLADKVALHPSGWHLFIELKPNFDNARDGAAFEKFLQGVRVLDGVSKVLTSNQFHTLGLPTYEENPHIAGQYLVLAGPETHLIADPAGGTSAPYAVAKPRFSHGDVPTRPQMYPAFVAAGPGVLRGQRIGHIRNVDIAPTVSFLLDLGMKEMSGRILDELFVK